MKYLKITNPTEITKDEIELFGYSDKRGDSRLVGEKGTGLKFSRLQAMRQGIETYIVTNSFISTIDKERVNDYTERVIFSYKNKGKRANNVKSSYTVNGGIGDWKDEWFILREFVQNARDEMVRAEVCSPDEAMSLTLRSLEVVDVVTYADPGKTSCYISLTPGVEEVFKNIGKYFVFGPDFKCKEGALYFTKKEKAAYKNGIFVEDLMVNSSCFASYDYYGVALSESRTLKHKADIFEGAIKILNAAPLEIKKDFLGYIEKNFHNDECRRSWDFNKFTGEDWKTAFIQKYGENCVVHDCETCSENSLEKLKSKNLSVVSMHKKMYDCLKQYGVKTLAEISHINSEEDFKLIDVFGEERSRLEECISICDRIFQRKFQVYVFDAQSNEQTEMCGCYSNVTEKIFINSDRLGTKEKILDTLIEEYIHGVSGANDFSRGFQDFACKKIRELVLVEESVTF